MAGSVLDDRDGVVPLAVSVDGVSCVYGAYRAVAEVSLSVRQGEIHALLGTNGAGKTTLLETVQGLRPPAAGSIRVFGLDAWKRRAAVAGRTGTMLQESGLVDEMTVADQLALWKGLSLRADSVDRMLDLVGLEHRRRVQVSQLSGGERRRLDFAMALWGGPELVILDEPTTGLDPQSRHTMWSIIRELNGKGTTVLLTTHYLDEAQSLADTVTILDRGRIAVTGSMTQVLATIPARITFTTTATRAVISRLAAETTGELVMNNDRPEQASAKRAITVRTPELQRDVAAVVDWARMYELTLDALRCAPASLEEVFLGVPPTGAAAGAARENSEVAR